MIRLQYYEDKIIKRDISRLKGDNGIVSANNEDKAKILLNSIEVISEVEGEGNTK